MRIVTQVTFVIGVSHIDLLFSLRLEVKKLVYFLSFFNLACLVECLLELAVKF